MAATGRVGEDHALPRAIGPGTACSLPSNAPLLDGPRRFTALLEAAPGLSDRVLSRRLKELEAAGIVTRAAYPEVPPRVEYELTSRGRELRPVIEEMERWGRRARSPG